MRESCELLHILGGFLNKRGPDLVEGRCSTAAIDLLVGLGEIDGRAKNGQQLCHLPHGETVGRLRVLEAELDAGRRATEPDPLHDLLRLWAPDHHHALRVAIHLCIVQGQVV